MKKTGRLLGLILILFASDLLCWGQKVREKDLPEKYRDWLDLARYIILDKERDVFLQLTNDRERDIFIETFWKQRDPTPGTPENEFKEEHVKRFNYANKIYGRRTARAGWMTDMGRIHIILGTPVSKEYIEGTNELYPCEIWSYYGEKGTGQPTHFSLVFFQRGAGEYKLYDPISDGPARLLIHSDNADPFDYETLYEYIKQKAPTLALVSLSIIPGDIPYNFQPSPEHVTMLANILESPKKAVSASYATHFLSYRGVVSVDYMTNFVDSETEVALIEDPVTGINFLHFAISPKNLSVQYYQPKDQYFCNLRLDVSLRDGENVILQYAKDFPLYFSPDELGKIRSSGLSLEDAFPLVEGKHKLIILLQNSVEKEFSIYEQDISLAKDTGGPSINGPYLGYKFDTYQSDLHIPFKVLDKKLAVDPKATFGTGEEVAFMFNVLGLTKELWQEGRVRIEVKGLREKDSPQKSYSVMLNAYSFQKIVHISQSIPAQDIVPDYYELKIYLEDGQGRTVAESKANFIVSPDKLLPHPTAKAKAMSLANNFIFFYMLAHQYDKLEENENAAIQFQKAFALNPEYTPGLVQYANFLLKVSQFDRALEVVERLKENEKLKFDYFLVRGKALMGKGQYDEAISNLLEGNKIYNSDTGLLNSLGLSYYRKGDRKKALEALEASLRLNPAQATIKELIEKIKKL